MNAATDAVLGELDDSRRAIASLVDHVERLGSWALLLGRRLVAGGRLLVAGNGGSSAHAHHLTSELVGRFRDDRRPFSAICLSSESSSVTAIGNDYGFDQVFARQVEAHGRPDDLLLAISTSGASANLLAAVSCARGAGLTTMGLTGPGPNPLAAAVDSWIGVEGRTTAAVQAAHQVVVHALCAAFEAELEDLQLHRRRAS